METHSRKQNQKQEMELKKLVFQDELTGLGNRRSLRIRLNTLLSPEKPSTVPLALFMLDMDHFKLMNDRYGHVAGDKLIQHVGRILSETVNEAGEVYRYAGDEFTILLPGADDQSARRMAERILLALSGKAFKLSKSSDPEKITLSLGVALWPNDAQDPMALIQAADRGLYRAKRQGRNRACLVRDTSKTEEEWSHRERMIESMSTLIGREREIRAIEDALRGKKTSLPRALFFLAGSGMGKSSLVEEGVRRARNLGFAGAIARGFPEDVEAPYSGIKKLLHDLETQMELDLSSRETVLSYLRGESAESQQDASSEERAETFSSILRLLIDLSEERPLCLGMDNMDYMDEATVYVCRTLLSTQETPHIVFLVSGPDPSGQEPGTALANLLDDERISSRLHRYILNPLSQSDLLELLDPLALQDADRVAEMIHQCSRGIPILAHHLIRRWFLREEGALEMPVRPSKATVNDMTLEALEDLDPQARDLLLRASAVGETFTPDDLSSFLVARNPGHILDLLEGAKRAELVEETPSTGTQSSYRFATRDTKRATYTELPGDEKEQIHEALAKQWEEQKQDLAALMRSAFHYAQSGQKAKSETLHQEGLSRAEHVFVASEADSYLPTKQEKPETGFQEEDLPLIGEIIRNLRVSVQNVRLFPANSQMVIDPVNLLMGHLTQLFDRSDAVTFSVVEGNLLVNASELPQKEGLAESALDLSFLLTHHKVHSLTVRSNVSFAELKSLVDALATKGGEFTKEGAFSRKLKDMGVYHVVADERVYVSSTLSEMQTAPPKVKKIVEEPPPVIEEAPPPAPPAAEEAIQANVDKASWEYALQALFEAGNERGLAELAGSLRDNKESVREMVIAQRPSPDASANQWISFLQRAVSLMDMGLVDNETLLGGLPSDKAEALRVSLEREKDPKIRALTKNMPAAEGKGSEAEVVSPETPAAAEEEPPLDLEESPTSPPPHQEGTESASQFNARVDQLWTQFQRSDLLAHEPVDALRQLIDEMSGTPKPGWVDSLNGLANRLEQTLETNPSEKVLLPLSNLSVSLIHRLVLTGSLEQGLRLLGALKSLEKDQENPRGEKAVTVRKSIHALLRTQLLPLAFADLASGRPDRMNGASAILAAAGPDAAEEIVQFLSRAQDNKAKETAGQILAAMGNLGKRRFLEALSTTPSVEARRHLLSVLHLFDDEDVWMHLDTILDGEDAATVRSLIHPLSRAATERAVPFLLRIAGREDAAVKREAIIALGRVGDSRATVPLLQFMEDKGLLGGVDENLAREACIALGRIGEPRAANLLINVMWGRTKGYLRRGWSPRVAAAAAWAVGQIDTTACRQALKEAAKRGKGPVKTVATLALEQKLEDEGDRQEDQR